MGGVKQRRLPHARLVRQPGTFLARLGSSHLEGRAPFSSACRPEARVAPSGTALQVRCGQSRGLPRPARGGINLVTEFTITSDPPIAVNVSPHGERGRIMHTPSCRCSAHCIARLPPTGRCLFPATVETSVRSRDQWTLSCDASGSPLGPARSRSVANHSSGGSSIVMKV